MSVTESLPGATTPDSTEPTEARAAEAAHGQARGWLSLALGSLLVGGALSLMLVVSRIPGMTRFIDAPLVAKKSLVIHVNLVLTCWFLAFLAALFSMIPARRQRHWPILLALAGMAIFTVSGLIPGAMPILCNYVPVLDEPAFLVGLGVFGLGVALALLDPERLLGRGPARQGESFLSPAAMLGLRVAAWIGALGALVFASGAWFTPREGDHHSYFESVFWGGGHVFLFVFVAAMLVVWTLLVREATGACPLQRPALSRLVFGLVLVPALPGLWLLGKAPTDAGFYSVPTEMMRWGTWLAPALTLFLSARALLQARAQGRLRATPSVPAFLVSVTLLALGIGLGIFITRSSTLVPAHYHATVGAVTVALMGMTHVFLDALGRPLVDERAQRWARWQPLIFGAGQVGFVCGYAYAGVHGLGRKVYGSEQLVRSVEQTVGLAVAGTGGTFALVGGALFFVLVLRRWRGR